MANEWREVEHDGRRVRYREGESPVPERVVYELEYWHDLRREWRRVNNINSREWFAIGREAA